MQLLSCGSCSDLQSELLGKAKRWLRAQLTVLDASRASGSRKDAVVTIERCWRSCSCRVQTDRSSHVGGLAQPRKIFESVVRSCAFDVLRVQLHC
jgi:hypothetical protein